jgi:hypothetical protein
MAVLDDILSEIGLPSVRVASRRAPRPTFSPEEEASILGTIGQNTLSGLQYVGETLDKPGRAIRGLLAGQPGELANLIPFSDTIGLTDPQQSVSGRGLLEQYGMLGPNQDGIDFGDVAGFGAEVLFDPTTYLTLGASALSKGGNVAKRAGLMKELTKVTGKRVGAREGRLTKTLNDLLAPRAGEHVRDPFDFLSWATPTPSSLRTEAAERAAKGIGINDIASIADEPLGGLAGIGLPFRDSSAAIGTGARSQAVARKLDKLGDAVKYSGPVSTLNRLFDAKVGESKSYVGQKFLMPGAFDASTAARADARGKSFDLMADLARNGGAIADNNQAMRRLYEGIDPAAAPAMAAHVDKYRGAMDPLVTRADAIGMPAHELIDDVAKYATRQLTGVTRGGSSSKVIDVVDQNFQARDPWLKNLTEGTDTILQMRNDPGIQQLRGGPLADLTTDITNRYGSQIPATFEDAAGNVRDQREAIARWFQNMDDNVWESGVYGNHPLVDAATRIVNGYDRVAVGENILDNLDLDTISLADKTSRTPGQSRTLKATLEGMGLVAGDENKGAVKAWMERQGMPVTKAGVDVTGQMNIPLDLSDDLIRRMQAFKSPEAVNEILSSLIDPITNITKAGLTSAAPAFHARNLASGQWQNAQAGMWSKRAFDVARALATADVGDIPIMKRMLQQQGLPNTPENASDMVRRLGYQFNLTSPQQSIAAVQGRTGAAQGFGDLIAESPGGVVAGRGQPFRKMDALNKLLGRNGETLNPLKAEVRGGFTDAAETTFAPIAAGEHIGSYVEFLNRYTPFIDQLYKGVDPAEAAARVMAAQVDYGGRNYTAFERSVMQRVAPFYKFTKGMVPYTLRRLWEKPGGAIAQTIRAQNEGRSGDASAPDYVRETAAIGLGQQEDGSQRYITGFGLPFEDPLSFIGGGVQGALLEGASRLNPLVKAPLEWMTGESFFQKGPQGGREIEDLDPTIGRIMSNVAGWGDGQAAAYSEPVKLPTPVEFLAANSPLSRLLTTIRAATDERKHDPAGMMNLLSGIKVSDISPAAQDAVTRERMQALMKSLGAKSFENVYFPKAQVAEMPPEQQMKVLQLEALKQELVRKAKERKAAAAK